jgi:DNA repair exonuclease SbcCD nuclease subunit
VRVLFLADTHLGFDLPSHPRVMRRRRGHDFFDSFQRALEPARAGEADIVVHGGDLLYRSGVPAWLTEAALAPLRRIASSGVPVLLVPGNHERSRVPHPLFAIDEGLHVFDRPRTVVLAARGARVAFTGFPYTRQIRDRVGQVLASAGRGAGPVDVRVLLMHQCVEGATCGPGNYTFRSGDEVIRGGDLPRDVAVTLCGHIHRHQVLRPRGRPPIIYAGSTERTSFAEAAETKGYVLVELTRAGLGAIEFRPLPVRPMMTRTLSLDALPAPDAMALVAQAIASTPEDAVVQLRVDGAVPSGLTAAVLREMAGARNVMVVAGHRARWACAS